MFWAYVATALLAAAAGVVVGSSLSYRYYSALTKRLSDLHNSLLHEHVEVVNKLTAVRAEVAKLTMEAKLVEEAAVVKRIKALL